MSLVVKNLHFLFAALLFFAAFQKSLSTTLDPTVEAVTQNAVIFTVAASDSSDWKGASVSITAPGTVTTEKYVSTDVTAAGATHTFAAYGLSAATKYEFTVASAEAGTPSAALSPANQPIVVCTAAAPLADLMVDTSGTTDAAIKIKWTSVATATYKVYLDNTEIDADVVVDSSDFTYDTNSLSGKSASLKAGTVQKCKVEVVIPVTGCPNGGVTGSNEIDCSLKPTDCKSGAVKMYPVLTFTLGLIKVFGLQKFF